LLILRASLNQSRRGVIRFLGSFTHGATFNIILEYANGGTLENYFRQFPPPSLSRDIHHFWESLLRLISVLTYLQNLKFYDNSVYQGYAIMSNYFRTFTLIWTRWHFDIKPSNILVCFRDPENYYDCDFKLADFGSSLFRIKADEKELQVAAGKGTRTYGMAELFKPRGQADIEQVLLNVTFGILILTNGFHQLSSLQALMFGLLHAS
jgi:serine/threonine protein kinase